MSDSLPATGGGPEHSGIELYASTEPRKRINGKQTSKGEWYFEATVETHDGSSPARKLLDLVIETEGAFRQAGKKLVTT